MELTTAGDLVTIATDGPPIDGIVFDTPSAAKVVVAVIDPRRGPVLRTVDPKLLTLRPDAGPDDRALGLLIRRTPPVTHSAARAGASARTGRAGHGRASMHRTTGK